MRDARVEVGRYRVVRCDRCRLESLFPQPTLEELRAYYSNYPTTKTSEQDLLFLIEREADLLKWIENQMNGRKGNMQARNFLDIGFGNGASLFSAAKLGWSAFGVDMDASNISNAEAFGKKTGVQATYVCGEIFQLEQEDRTYDLIKASQVLEHVLDPLAFLRKCNQLQLPGGHLMIDCPNAAALFWKIKNLLRKTFDRMDYYNSLKSTEHLWGYTSRSLSVALEKAGYQVVFCRDYPMGHGFFQPETRLWYPPFATGLKRSLQARNTYHVLKSCVQIFDWMASSSAGRGMGLMALAKKLPVLEPIKSGGL